MNGKKSGQATNIKKKNKQQKNHCEMNLVNLIFRGKKKKNYY